MPKSLKTFVFIFTLFHFYHWTKADSNALATITEFKVHFMVLGQVTQFNCFTRYSVSESEYIELYYGDKRIYQISNTDHLSYDIPDAWPGNYKCKVGSSEVIFHLNQEITVLPDDVAELEFGAQLAHQSAQIGIQSAEPGAYGFLCYQDENEMKPGYHDVRGGTEDQGYNGTAESKVKTNYRCTSGDSNFEFSFTNNVDDPYPRISSFEVEFVPSADGSEDHTLQVFCRAGTHKARLMIFVDDVILKVNQLTNEAIYSDKYTKQRSFKCILESDYGRDVISWGIPAAGFDRYNLNKEIHVYDTVSNRPYFNEILNLGLALFYKADNDKQITEMKFWKDSLSNGKDELSSIECTVNAENPEYQYESVVRDKETIFTEFLEAYTEHTCRSNSLSGFKTVTYTKDWLRAPRLESVMVEADLGFRGKMSLRSICYETNNNLPPNSWLATSIYKDNELINGFQKNTDGLTGESTVADKKEYNSLGSIKCVVENDIGYEQAIINFRTGVRAKLKLDLKFPNATMINSIFHNNQIGDTNCTNDGQKAYVWSQQKDYYRNQDRSGNYSCLTNYNDCSKYPCKPAQFRLQLDWIRSSKNFIPDGTLKKLNDDEKFKWSTFGFSCNTVEHTCAWGS